MPNTYPIHAQYMPNICPLTVFPYHRLALPSPHVKSYPIFHETMSGREIRNGQPNYP
jgi:hypothetical protein